MLSRIVIGVVAAALVATAVPAQAAGKVKLKPSVTYAKTWEAAVAEAKLLNVPIVVHSHGFYCPPCWGMHSSLLQNEKYIKFAEKSTVEVISLSRLDEGIEKKEHRAQTYVEKRKDGTKVEYLVEFPGMTVDEMLALNSSKAGTYNKTGKIPYTSLVDPWTEEEIEKWSGGQAASTIMEAVATARKKLVQEHGEGIARKDVKALEAAETEAKELSAEGEYAKALAALDKLSKNAQAWPQPMQDRLTTARTGVVKAAEAAVDGVQRMKDEDPAAAKKELAKLGSRLKGTGLEDRLKDLAEGL